MTRQISAMWLAVLVALAGVTAVAAEGTDATYPTLVTAETRASAEKLSALERPGDIFFRDEFESPDSLKKYFEIRGLREGRVKLTTNAQLAHEGNGAIQFTSPARMGVSLVLEPPPGEVVHRLSVVLQHGIVPRIVPV